MDVREKMVELIDEIIELYPSEREELADGLIAKGVTVQEWISVKDGLPEAEEEVLVCANRNGFKIITNAMYEDGKMTTEDSTWTWYDHNFEYDEENDTFIIPEGWWECKHYNCDDEYNHCIDDVVTHWMPMPLAPEVKND